MGGISVERGHKVLEQGARIVCKAVDELPGNSAVCERAQNVRDLLPTLTWCEARGGGAYALHDGDPTDVLIVLFSNRELDDLGHTAAFQTVPYEDGTIRLNVRLVSFTPLWAGLGLFHELSHVYDFRSGAEPREPSDEQYLKGEARAFHLEVVLLDALAAGRLSTALTRELPNPLSPQALAADPGTSLSGRLERATIQPGSPPPGSDSEMGVRDAAHRIAALLAFHFQESDPLAIENPEAAAPDLGRFFSAAPRMEQVLPQTTTGT